MNCQSSIHRGRIDNQYFPVCSLRELSIIDPWGINNWHFKDWQLTFCSVHLTWIVDLFNAHHLLLSVWITLIASPRIWCAMKYCDIMTAPVRSIQPHYLRVKNGVATSVIRNYSVQFLVVLSVIIATILVFVIRHICHLSEVLHDQWVIEIDNEMKG